MSIEKISVIDQIEVTEKGFIQIRRADKIMEDGKELSRSYHRTSLAPGDDLTGQDDRVKAIAQAVWTAEVITAYQAQLANRKI